MAEQQGVTISAPVPANTFLPIMNNGAGGPLPRGTVLAQAFGDSGLVATAKADSHFSAYALGIAATPAIPFERVHCQFAGPLTLETEEWDAVTGQTGGLTVGAPYYVSDAVGGKLTVTPPVTGGHFVSPVGIATQPTTLFIQISLGKVI